MVLGDSRHILPHATAAYVPHNFRDRRPFRIPGLTPCRIRASRFDQRSPEVLLFTQFPPRRHAPPPTHPRGLTQLARLPPSVSRPLRLRPGTVGLTRTNIARIASLESVNLSDGSPSCSVPDAIAVIPDPAVARLAPVGAPRVLCAECTL